MKFPLILILSILLIGISLSAAEVVQVDVKYKPSSKAWKSMKTTIVGDAGKPADALNRYGGHHASVYAKTGFFHVQQLKDSWVIVDPEGSPFVSKGINSVTRGFTKASKSAFKDKFGDVGSWTESTVQAMKTAGFNTLGSWSDWRRFRNTDSRIPYTILWSFMSKYGKKAGGTYMKAGHFAYPGDCIYVFDKAFEVYCDERAREMLKLKDDPYLLGYYSDNEMPLHLKMLDRYLELEKDNEGYLAAVAWLKEKEISHSSITNEVRETFVEYAAEKYFSIIKRAIKKYDPNHMYLGCRFHAGALNLKPLFKAAREHLDIISINWYRRWTPDVEKMENWKQWSGRPFIITEFYAKGMDSGMGNTSGAGWVVKTQRDRGYFYQNFTLALLKHPNCVGWHWHRYMDNDPDAGQDPSNIDSNKGIVNCRYEPHGDLITQMQRINTVIFQLRNNN